MERDFKGVWIPKEVWLDQRLNALDKIILVEIDSLDNGEMGCYASNKYLADFCQCSESKVSRSVSKLVELNYVYTASFNGRTRILKSRLGKLPRQTGKIAEADKAKEQANNIVNNKENNIKERKKETPAKATSYDEIIDKQVDDPELKATLYEFIKMRKLMKKPMTDKALDMLISRLYKLEAETDRQIEVLNQSIMNNWLGIFPLKENKSQQKPKKQMTKEELDYLDYLDSLG